MDPVLASHFLTGAIITLVLPVGILVIVGLYWWAVWRRGGHGITPRSR